MDPETQIKDKVIIITGGLGGIGSKVVKKFLENNAKHVAIFDINEEAGYNFEAKLNEEFGPNRAKFVKCDITVEEELRDAFNNIVAEQKYVDVFINNAAVMNLRNLRKQVEINVIALMSGTLYAMEHMGLDKGGKGGTIINISSGLAFMKSHHFAIYAATKAAVLHFTSCLGIKPNYAKTGVRVITLCFGKTDTYLVNKAEISEVLETTKKVLPQKPESAAEGVVVAFKLGDSGSVWSVKYDESPQDITGIYNESLTSVVKILT